MNANKTEEQLQNDSDNEEEKYCCSCGKYDIWYNLGDADTPMCKCNPDFEGECDTDDEDEDEEDEVSDDEEEDEVSDDEEEDEEDEEVSSKCPCCENVYTEAQIESEEVVPCNKCYKCFVGDCGVTSCDCDTESKAEDINEAEDLYDNFVIEEWDKKDDGTDGFSYIQNHDLDLIDEIDNKMNNEICLNYENFNAERSCMWVEEVKRRAKWVRGETIYGDNREKHYTYPIWWSRDKTKIGYYTWILEGDGYVSFLLHNGYTRDDNANTKYKNFIRPECLYNDKNLDGN